MTFITIVFGYYSTLYISLRMARPVPMWILSKYLQFFSCLFIESSKSQITVSFSSVESQFSMTLEFSNLYIRCKTVESIASRQLRFSIQQVFNRRGQWQPPPVLLPRESLGGGAWWAAVHGVAKSWAWPSDFTFTFHFHALEKETATHSSVPAWRIPGMGEPGGLPSMGSHRVGHDWNNLAAAAGAQ